ncbi:putative nuclease HARBI1 [Ixodes scapularis]
MRRPVSAKTCLQLTLRYLASGESHHSLSRQFRVGHSAVNDIIHSTCAVIYDMLKDEELAAPKSTDAWLRVAQQFSHRWQFPNCVGGIDGKHVAIIKPAKSGTVYYNYKKTYSILLFALVDASCKFLYVDVGTPGSKGDAAIWQTTPLQKAVTNRSSGLPDLVDMNTSSGLQLPPVIVGDDAFPLSSNLMKPFGGNSLTPEQKIFNYRPERVRTMVQAACVLHNLLKGHPDQLEQPRTSKEPGKKPTFFSLRPSKARPGALAVAVRERLCNYFSGEGAVPWQNKEAGVDISHLRKQATVSVPPGI